MKKLTKSVLAVVLTASFTVSYAQKTKVDTTGTKDIQEVVVTALGIKREKKALGYATQEVSGDVISEVPVSNFADVLSGEVAGLDTKSSGTIGGSSNIVIRGIKSISGSNQALIVIDGVPINNETYNTSAQRGGSGGYDYGNAAADINPNDIEKVNVLKGAAATSLYGSRGANGVIMITTKKGKKSKNIGVDFNSSVTFGFKDKSTLPEYQNQYGAGYYGSGYTNTALGFKNGWYYYGDMDGDGVNDPVVPYDYDGSFGNVFDNQMVYQWNSFYPNLPTYKQKTPWAAAKHTPNDIWSALSTTENSISLSGANDNGNFRAGFTNFIQTGGLPNTSLKKNTINFNGSYNLDLNLKAFAGLSYVNNSDTGLWGTGYDSRNQMQTFRQWWQTNVDMYEQRDAYYATGQNISWDPAGGINQGITDLNPIYHDNFYWMRDHNVASSNRNRYIGNVGLDYKINSWLSVLGRFTFDNYNDKREERISVGSTEPGRDPDQWLGRYTLYNRDVSEKNYDLIFTFNKSLTDKLDFEGNAGWNLRVNDYGLTGGQTSGGLKIPGLYTLANSVNPISSSNTYVNSYKAMVDGVYARGGFGFEKTYYLEGSYRTDRSSTLPRKNNRYNYWSVSGSIILSQIIKQDWLKYWKVRGNYATVGNSPQPYSVYNTYDLGTSFNGVSSASNPSVSNNPNLKPELTKSWEIGTELALFNNRVSLDLSYYNSTTYDQLTQSTVSPTSGVSAGWVNIGNINNKGIETSLKITPIKTNDFSWDMSINWAKNTNKVLSLAKGTEFYPLLSTTVAIGAWVGQPLGVIVGTDYYYDDKGNKLVGSNGQYVKRNDQVIGNYNPDWTGGIKNTFSYKNLSLSFLIDVQKGGDVFSLDTWYGYATGVTANTVGLNDLGNPIRNTIANGGGVILDGVTGTLTTNSDGTYTITNTAINNTRVRTDRYSNPWGYVNAPNKAHVYDASFVKLRNVSISYSIPKSMLSDTIFNNVVFSLVGRNLWIIHKNVPYADPESGLSAGNVQGFQSGAYPTFKEIGASIKVQF